MGLAEHAREELGRAGLFDEDSDYDGMLGKAVMELVEVFAKQSHSGTSAWLTIDLFRRVASYEALTPITSDPDEWYMHEAEMVGVEGVWQSKRQSDLFSKDGGKTWYSVNDKESDD